MRKSYILILSLILAILSVSVVSAGFFGFGDDSDKLTVEDLKINNEGYGMYKVTCNLEAAKEFDYLDLISIMSFFIGLQAFELGQKNLVENREQTEDTHKILSELQEHLNQQDEILANQDKILYKLNGKE